MRIYPLILFLLYSKALYSLSPPSQLKLCLVTGRVVEVSEEEGSNEEMKKIRIPIVKVRINQVSFSTVPEVGFLDCNQLKAKELYRFRNCAGVLFKKDQAIKGIVGRSKGGGAICIEPLE